MSTERRAPMQWFRGEDGIAVVAQVLECGVDDGAGARDRLDPAEGIERDRAVHGRR